MDGGITARHDAPINPWMGASQLGIRCATQSRVASVESAAMQLMPSPRCISQTGAEEVAARSREKWGGCKSGRWWGGWPFPSHHGANYSGSHLANHRGRDLPVGEDGHVEPVEEVVARLPPHHPKHIRLIPTPISRRKITECSHGRLKTAIEAQRCGGNGEGNGSRAKRCHPRKR